MINSSRQNAVRENAGNRPLCADPRLTARVGVHNKNGLTAATVMAAF
ncbi:MAG: hypothetical protein J5586_00685 [Clostridia bacterium]|nr:hypothetical protein [Clostridia bacterium]